MPRRTNVFQELVLLIERQLDSIGATVSESALVPDTLDGNLREVDILIKLPYGARELVIGIECRDHRRKADIQWIEQVRSKFDTLPIDKRVVVSKRGFTKNALVRAQEWNIEAISLEKAVKVDWAAALMSRSYWELLRFRFRFIKVRVALLPPEGIAGHMPVDPFLFSHHGIQETADELGQRFIEQKEIHKDLMDKYGDEHDWMVVSLRFDFPEGACSVLDELDVGWPVNWVEFDVLYKAAKTPNELQYSMYGDAVVGTAEGILDGEDFAIVMSQTEGSSPRGTIKAVTYGKTLVYELPESFVIGNMTDNESFKNGS